MASPFTYMSVGDRTPANVKSLLNATTCMSVNPEPTFVLCVRSIKLTRLLSAGTASCAEHAPISACVKNPAAGRRAGSVCKPNTSNTP